MRRRREKQFMISVVVCCYNASKRISDTVYGLVNQSAQKEKYEVIVVDNNSDDYGDLLEVIKKIDLGECNLKIIREMNLGLSYARNRGVQESKGEYVFFIDDDAVPSSQLIESYIKAIIETKPDVIGGNILPFFEVKPPSLLDSSIWGQWSIKYFGETDRWLTDDEYFLGTNIGAKRSILIKNKFDALLGRKGQKLMGGEEWFLGKKKYRRRFVAKAFVFHKIPEERMKMEYFVRRFKGWYIQTNQDFNLFDFLKAITPIVVKNMRKFLLLIKYELTMKYKIYKSMKNRIG